MTQLFDFYRQIKHCDQPLSATLKNSKERKIYFHPIEIYSEKTVMTYNTHALIKIDETTFFQITYNNNLDPSASFSYNRKMKKRLRNTSNTGLKFVQIEGKFFRINYGIRGQRY